MFESKSASLTVNNKSVKVHAFSTGAVKVKAKFLEASRQGLLSQYDIIFNKNFTEWLPVWVWVIEHPEGVYVIDAGITSDVMNKGYFKVLGMFSSWVNRTLFKFKVERHEEVDKQLESIGISPQNIKALILTHLHIDHILGIKHFEKTDILVNKSEWDKPNGDVPKLYPPWFKPVSLDLNEKYDVFDKAKALTAAKDLFLIHTPGHTNGHSSVLLKTDQGDILFAGDICYYEQQLTTNKFAGANVSLNKTKKTYEKVLAYSESNSVVVLPSHDEDAAKRLQNIRHFQPMRHE